MNISLVAATFIILSLIFASQTSAQAQVSLTPAVERLFNKVESDILSSAEAMPESQFNFTPANVHLDESAFKGVRTFAGQLMHVSTDNILIWSAVTGDSVRADIQDVNGPASITGKKAVIEYLKSSFAIGRKAIATLTDKNAMDMIQFRWKKLSRLDLVFYALMHANEHYGQLAIYLRFCNIVPPPTLQDR